MATQAYVEVNKANWDERAPEHIKAPAYAYHRFLTDNNFISNVVEFDRSLLGDITGLHVIHLQCHIGTDTISLARLGAKTVVGLDFSPASLKEARSLAEKAAGGNKLSFVEASVYAASDLLEPGSFDLVFTGVGALCWLPSINKWAETVSTLLKAGGRIFIREAHPVLWSIDEKITSALTIRYPYFEGVKPEVFEDSSTYVKLVDGKVFKNSKSMTWNHGLGEIITALLGVGMRVTGLVEHKSIPWDALPGQMAELDNGEFVLLEGQDWIPLTYTLQAVKL